MTDLTVSRAYLRTLVRTRDDFQNMRIRIENRIGLKASGEKQDKDTQSDINLTGKLFIIETADNLRKSEKGTEKELLSVLKEFPIYNEFLSQVKGIGTSTASWIIAEFDIETATTVSKMWQYAGLNPGMVKGKKAEKKEVKGKKTFIIHETNELIRGDKLTPEFVSPFNKKLRTVLCGIMADVFIKHQNNYVLNYYYPYKERLSNSSRHIGNDKEKKIWSETTPIHRHKAAVRYMVKMFLLDLYLIWRDLEGLPIREPYAEEYLDKKHGHGL